MEERGTIGSVTVYCSSSNALHADYFAEARALGEGLARSGRTLVYGGGSVGLMGEAARSCREAGGRVVGIITERLKAAEQMNRANSENIVVSTMRERKRLLESRGDAIVVLPGGLGTLEEFFEVLVGRLLGEHGKPIVLVNAADPDAPGRYYDPLLEMLGHMIRSRFAREGVLGLFEVCEDSRGALAVLDELGRGERAGCELDMDELVPTSAAEARRGGAADGSA